MKCLICNTDWYPERAYEPEEPCACGECLEDEYWWGNSTWSLRFEWLSKFIHWRLADLFWNIGTWIWRRKFE